MRMELVDRPGGEAEAAGKEAAVADEASIKPSLAEVVAEAMAAVGQGVALEVDKALINDI